MEKRRLRRDHFFLRKRLKCSNAATTESENQKMNTQSGASQEEVGGFVSMRSQTIGHVLCCICGVLTPPNGANMCKKCLRAESHIDDLTRRVNIFYCPECSSYLKPPSTWVKAERDSRELLTFCLGRLKKLSDFRLIDARFGQTEPNSKRIKLHITVQSEVLKQVYVENKYEIDYVVLHHMCQTCKKPTDQQHHWEAVVQVRQDVAQKRTLGYLESLILKHRAADSAVTIKQLSEGLDFFFAKKRDAVKFFEFVTSVVPTQPQNKFHKQLVSQDLKSNISRYRFNIAAFISPICHHDLIYLSPKIISSRLGEIGPLVICTKVRKTLCLLNPFTLKYCTIDGDQYWREPFKPLLSSKQLVKYIVLDVVKVSSSDEVDSRRRPRYMTLADVEVARVSDFGKNDRITSVRSHLGHLLKPGDYALGYDIYGANFNNSEAEEHKDSFPDAILIQKTFLKKPQKKPSKARSNNNDSDLDYCNKQIQNLSLYGNDLGESSHDEMDLIAAEAVQSSGLEDEFAHLDICDGDADGTDDCITTDDKE